MMMINTTSPENPRKCPSAWNLYENPFYITEQPQDNQGQSITKQLPKLERQHSLSKKHIHHFHLPVSARKITSSFCDLTFIKPLMESELESGRTQILDLKSELEYERKQRKKLESVNKKLARELYEERKNREEYESLSKKLIEEISFNETEINKLKNEIEEERKMLRVAEVFREERVQMKLSEAKHFLEKKLTELDEISISKYQENRSPDGNVERITTPFEGRVDSSSGEGRRSSLTEKSTISNESSGSVQSKGIQRRTISEIDNPHIRRGIKGFVEFPKVIRAMGSKSQRHSGDKLECQKAQIRLILKQKTHLNANNTIIAS